MTDFATAIREFDEMYAARSDLPRSLCTVDGRFLDSIKLRNKAGNRLEEYYKWQFVFGMIKGRGYPRDCIGVEIYLPKGNIGSTPIKLDACIFNSPNWLALYRAYRIGKDQDALTKLRTLMVCVVEFKREGKRIEQIFNAQIRAALKEPDAPVVLGYYYDEGRLYIFKRTSDGIFRLDAAKNFQKSQRILEQFQLELTDPYFLIPEYNQLSRLLTEGVSSTNIIYEVADLDPIYTVNGERFKSSLNRILRALDLQSMVDDQGYMIVIHLIASKIYDEKQAATLNVPLRFHIDPAEADFRSLLDVSVKPFVARIAELLKEARAFYKSVITEDVIDWKNVSHVKIAAAVVQNLQSFSFVKSRKKDLYSLLFYNFATALKKDQNAQFLTPLPIIQFLVEIVNPGGREKILDPCCGSSDFLSVALAREGSGIRAENLFGIDNDKKMVLLSYLNLLLSGDGNAVIKHVPDQGSLTNKFNIENEIVALQPGLHSGGQWQEWPDKTELLGFDVVLTNPPFGKGRNLVLANAHDRYAAEFYELYRRYIEFNPKDGLDLGVLFLENAVRTLKPGGRFGIVLSNSIASNNTWRFVREWLMGCVRLVALFDLPPNIFAETGVNTTLIVGYKPRTSSVADLVASDYEVFAREIHNVGYERRTANRNIVFEEIYRLDPVSFEVMMDSDGGQVLLEDFTSTISDFRDWCAFQETELRTLFLREPQN